MSGVSHVMLSVAGGDADHAEQFSAWLMDECPVSDQSRYGGCGELGLITNSHSQWGGLDHPECTVYAGTLRHADLYAVVGRFAGTDWNYPNAAQLFLMDAGEAFFRVWMLRDGKAWQFAPTSPHENEAAFWQLDES